jgi:DNA (cytosine-5)-methyltransferase 1
MKYLSVCSGIEAATVAWHPLGWQAAGFSEIEKFPSQVLSHHYPDVPNLGDMTNYKEWDIGTIDLLVGGTPCQSFSVAGLRKGMADPRGNLALVYCGILDHFRPRWFVWENVPGVLSSNGGRDFGSFLGALAELGYGFAYRVLDAQWFGVAQRRRRVFVVGCLGDWRSAAAVLFERESLCRDLAPSRKEGQKIANCLGASPSTSGSPNVGNGQGNVVSVSDVFPTLDANEGNKWGSNQWVKQGKAILQPIIMSHGQAQANITTNGVCPTLTCLHEAPIALAENTIGRQPMNGGNGDGFTVGGPMYTLNATGVHGVANAMAVRRLTPTECERLQGFPDGYTDIQLNGKQTPDGPRYKALGNSMAVPVMKWIGQRIKEIA